VQERIAKNKKHFLESWTSQVNSLGELMYSLPQDNIEEFNNLLKKLHQYVKIAGDSTYGVKYFETDGFKVCQQEGHDMGTEGTICLRCGFNALEEFSE